MYPEFLEENMEFVYDYKRIEYTLKSHTMDGRSPQAKNFNRFLMI